jgi:hypothetical protein
MDTSEDELRDRLKFSFIGNTCYLLFPSSSRQSSNPRKGREMLQTLQLHSSGIKVDAGCEAYRKGGNNRLMTKYTSDCYTGRNVAAEEFTLNRKRHLRVLGDEVTALLDVLLEISESSLDELLLVGVDLADLVDLLNTVGAELDAGGEEVNTLVLVERALNEGGLDDTLLALGGLQEGLGEASTGHGHGEGSGTGTVLGLDDLITTELNAVDERIAGLALNIGVVGLGEQRNDGDTGVATNNGDGLVGGIGLLDLGDEAGGTDDIEGGDTEETLGVVDTAGLEDLGDNGNGGVNLGVTLALLV